MNAPRGSQVLSYWVSETMFDVSKIGTHWSDQELDAIVEDYFIMLGHELAEQSYIKAAHSKLLMERLGRSHKSVEFKHQNISAVLDELGLPWIPGYKPKRNYQAAIFGAIDRYLSRTPETLEHVPHQTLAPDKPWNAIFVEAPAAVLPNVPKPPLLDRLVRKFDPVERDHRNRQLGKAGEEFVVELERRRLHDHDRADLSRKVRWVAAEDGDGAGYDILSFDPTGAERLIEVKTTNGQARTPFFLTRNELEVSEERRDAWRIYRVHQFAQRPQIFILAPPLDQAVHLRTEIWRASFG